MELLIIIFVIAISILSVVFGVFYINKQNQIKKIAPLMTKEKKGYKLAHFDKIIQKSTIEIDPVAIKEEEEKQKRLKEEAEKELQKQEEAQKTHQEYSTEEHHQEENEHNDENKSKKSRRKREINKRQVDLKTAIVYSNILKRKNKI